MADRPRPIRRPICWVLGHVMTVTLARPFCLRCAHGLHRA